MKDSELAVLIGALQGRETMTVADFEGTGYAHEHLPLCQASEGLAPQVISTVGDAMYVANAP